MCPSPRTLICCALAVGLVAFAAACNEETPFFPDAGPDTIVITDTGTDAAIDVGPGPDTSGDTGVDTGTCREGATMPHVCGTSCVCSSGTWICPDVDCPMECEVDADCVVSGCSSQICAAVPMDSDCAWLPEFACLRPPTTSCGCNDGYCGWAQTPELAECVDNPPCSPGDVREDPSGCGVCYCDDAGEWACELNDDCPPPRCEPGEVGGECGECVCTDAGEWNCADVDCPLVECEPGTERSEGCNHCVCDESGHWLCTGLACPECDPGEVGGECGECVCTEDGFWACHDGLCAPECDPGEAYEEGCMYCVCGEDGRFECMPSPDCGAECMWGEEYYDPATCEYCTCDDDRRWECYAPPECGGECVPGDERVADDGCNTCFCQEDGTWACTERACACVPGEERMDDDGCNVCTCVGGDGWACTDRACGNECVTDADCVVTGCSGQVCASEPVGTTCEWRDEYACYAESDITSCGCNAGFCGWAATPELDRCLSDAG